MHGIGGVVDLAEQLLGEVGGGDLAIGVTAVEPAQDPVEAALGETLMRAQQPASDPVERIAGMATVTERVLLDPAADLIQGLVGEADQMEVVDDDRGVGQPAAHGGGVGLMRVDDDVFDPVPPGLGLGGEPGGDGVLGAAFEHVDGVAGVEVHDVGDEHRRRRLRRCQERRLIEADRPWCAERGHVSGACSSVVSDGVHGRPPRHAELAGECGDGLAARADPAGDVGAGAFGEHGSFVDLMRRVGEAADRAVRVGATPQLLAPHQPNRHPRDRQVAHDVATPVVAPRSAATARAADRAERSAFDPQRPLSAHEPAGGDHELVQPDQRGRVATVILHQGPPW